MKKVDSKLKQALKFLLGNITSDLAIRNGKVLDVWLIHNLSQPKLQEMRQLLGDAGRER